jgi:diguanylate cyclase (GGDEF)-like protein
VLFRSAKDAGGNLVASAGAAMLSARSPAALRRRLRAAGMLGVLERFESALSRQPQDISAPPHPEPSLRDLLARIKDPALQESLSDFIFRNHISGLRNRLWLDENVARLSAAGRLRGYAALDFDKFGDVNRALGEVRADRIISIFGAIIARTLEGRDAIPLHISGEEFCILIGPRETDKRSLLEEVRQKVQDELGLRAEREGIAKPDGGTLRITVSIGAADIESSRAAPLSAVLQASERAESALMRAKSAGRNRVVLDGD